MTINTNLEFDGATPNNARLQKVINDLADAITSINNRITGPLTVTSAAPFGGVRSTNNGFSNAAFTSGVYGEGHSIGTAAQTRVAGLEGYAEHDNSGLIDVIASVFADSPGNGGAGTATVASSIYADDASSVPGASTCASIYVKDLHTTSGANYAIRTGDGKVYHGDTIIIHKNSAPADADLAAGDVALWLDATNGAAKLMIKGKSADGTVVTGSVALT